ncbi:hypothetical protein OQA88_813 [Cercophora sp. LCS_1]
MEELARRWRGSIDNLGNLQSLEQLAVQDTEAFTGELNPKKTPNLRCVTAVYTWLIGQWLNSLEKHNPDFAQHLSYHSILVNPGKDMTFEESPEPTPERLLMCSLESLDLRIECFGLARAMSRAVRLGRATRHTLRGLRFRIKSADFATRAIDTITAILENMRCILDHLANRLARLTELHIEWDCYDYRSANVDGRGHGGLPSSLARALVF